MLRPLGLAVALLLVPALAGAQPAEVAAEGLSGPGAIARDAQGRVYVVEAGGRLVELADRDGDGRFEERATHLDGVAGLSGLAAADGGLWLAAGDSLLWWPEGAAQAEVLARGLPPAPDGQRPLGIGPDGRLYIGGRALLTRFDPRDADLGVYASGFSAATGFGWHPATLGFWGVDQGQPGAAPAELNRLVIANDYGGRCGGCDDGTGAALTLPLHPTAMVFLTGDGVPDEFRGGICYLDEIVEARQDTTVVIHPLTDERRVLPLEKRNELVRAHPDFQLVISYNPGYQSVLKDLKESTKQRFGAIDFGYPAADIEAEIVAHEAQIPLEIAARLVRIGERSRHLKGHGLEEGASTRMLVYAGRLVARGIPLERACRVALVLPITDDPDIRDALGNAIAACIG